MQEFSLKISQRQIIYDSQIGYKKKPIKGVINWFQSITPTHNEKGDVCLEFKFSEKLKPFLLELKEYSQIDYKDILPLGSGYSIRLFKIFRAYRDKMQKHQYRSKLKYSLEEFRTVLAIQDKYEDWRKLNRMLVKTLGEINELTRINVELNLQRKGRKVVGLEFEFWDKEGRGKKSRKVVGSAPMQPDGLTFAQEKALEILTEFGVTEGIAKQMVSKPLGSEVHGFEDWYFEYCIGVVESKSTVQIEGAKPGVLVNWFLKKGVFEQGDHFAKIMEHLAARKKGLETSNPKAWENRLMARGMTAGEFRTISKS